MVWRWKNLCPVDMPSETMTTSLTTKGNISYIYAHIPCFAHNKPWVIYISWTKNRTVAYFQSYFTCFLHGLVFWWIAKTIPRLILCPCLIMCKTRQYDCRLLRNHICLNMTMNFIHNLPSRNSIRVSLTLIRSNLKRFFATRFSFNRRGPSLFWFRTLAVSSPPL